jgi:hypothetical protein
MTGAEAGSVTIEGMHGEPSRRLAAATVVTVTMRDPLEELYVTLRDDPRAFRDAGILSLRAAGDCLAPALLSEAVYGGHGAARALDGPDTTDMPFRIEQVPADFDPPLPWQA